MEYVTADVMNDRFYSKEDIAVGQFCGADAPRFFLAWVIQAFNSKG